jgi:hypothetical protein
MSLCHNAQKDFEVGADMMRFMESVVAGCEEAATQVDAPPISLALSPLMSPPPEVCTLRKAGRYAD